jgi:hypothetical protein
MDFIMKTISTSIRVSVVSALSVVAIFGAFASPVYAAVDPVTSFTATYTDSQITLSWVTPSGEFSGIEIRESTSPLNESNFNAAPQVAGVPSPAPGQTQTVQVSGLAQGTTYYFGARITSIIGETSPIVTVSAATPATPSPVPPVTSLTATPVNCSLITLSWVTPSGEFSGIEIRESTSPLNESNFNAAPQVAGVPQPVAGTQTVDVSGLQPGTTYYFGIRIASIYGGSSPLATVSGTTDPVPVVTGGGSSCPQPNPVGNFIISFTDSSADLSWSTPADGLINLEIRQSQNPINDNNFNAAIQIADVPQSVPGQTQTMQVNGLASSTLYYFGIRVASLCGSASPVVVASGTTQSAPSVLPAPSSSVSVMINGGATSTATSTVTLSIFADNATEMTISDIAPSGTAVWQSYATTTSWILSSGDGQKFVYVKFRNGAGEFSETASSSIMFISGQTSVTEPAPVVAKVVAVTPTNKEISFYLLPNKVTSIEGDRIKVMVAAKSNGSGILASNEFKIAYPSNLLTLESVTYNQNWVLSPDVNTNVNDAEHGLLIQNVRPLRDFEGSQVLVTLSFLMRKSGSGSIELTSNSTDVLANVTIFSIIASEKDARPRLFASLISSLGSNNQNFIAFGVVLVIFLALFMISSPLVKFLCRKFLK